jgi:hypothetical protein
MPVTLLISLLILAVAVAGVVWLYRSGARGPGAAPQSVGAPLGDVRVAAPPQAQAPDAAAGLSIYKDKGETAGAPNFTSPPEEPTARPTPSQAMAPPADVAPPPPPPPSAPDAAGAKAAAHGDALGALIDRSTEAAARPAARPLAKPVARPEQVAQASGGAADVQIGAFSTAAQADQAWSAAASIAPGAMAGKGKRVAPMTHDGATLYRTFITGFASRDAAQALCDRLRAGGRSCFVR